MMNTTLNQLDLSREGKGRRNNVDLVETLAVEQVTIVDQAR